MKFHSNVPDIAKQADKSAPRNRFKSSSFSGSLRVGIVASALFAASVTGCAETSYSSRQNTANPAANVDGQNKDAHDRLDTTLTGVLAATGLMTAAAALAYYGDKKEMPSTRNTVLLVLDIQASVWCLTYALTGGHMGGGSPPGFDYPFPQGPPMTSLPGHR
jgi:tetrahydromethanopterin S-methyltransferase subunit E